MTYRLPAEVVAQAKSAGIKLAAVVRQFAQAYVEGALIDRELDAILAELEAITSKE